MKKKRISSQFLNQIQLQITPSPWPRTRVDRTMVLFSGSFFLPFLMAFHNDCRRNTWPQTVLKDRYESFVLDFTQNCISTIDLCLSNKPIFCHMSHEKKLNCVAWFMSTYAPNFSSTPTRTLCCHIFSSYLTDWKVNILRTVIFRTHGLVWNEVLVRMLECRKILPGPFKATCQPKELNWVFLKNTFLAFFTSQFPCRDLPKIPQIQTLVKA